MGLVFSKRDVIVFQGDSITDGNRDKNNPADLGRGFVKRITDYLREEYADLNLTFFNRGVSGDRVQNLARRWTKDCIILNPNWVSILVGVNDTIRRYDSGIRTSPEKFESLYKNLLERTVSEVDAQVILMDPFFLNFPPERENWRTDLNPKIEIVKSLADEFNAIHISLDKVFRGMTSAGKSPEKLAEDGFHPTTAGQKVISEHWLKAVGAK